MLDDDYYIRGLLPLRRYRSIRVRLERQVERLHALVDGASRQRIVLHPEPRQLWSGADFGQRRELARLIVERVDVMQARRGARFDPSRVAITNPGPARRLARASSATSGRLARWRNNSRPAAEGKLSTSSGIGPRRRAASTSRDRHLEDLRSFAREHLSAAKLLRHVVIVDGLPRTLGG